jgi:hypothetical protein
MKEGPLAGPFFVLEGSGYGIAAHRLHAGSARVGPLRKEASLAVTHRTLSILTFFDMLLL